MQQSPPLFAQGDVFMAVIATGYKLYFNLFVVLVVLYHLPDRNSSNSAGWDDRMSPGWFHRLFWGNANWGNETIYVFYKLCCTVCLFFQAECWTHYGLGRQAMSRLSHTKDVFPVKWFRSVAPTVSRTVTVLKHVSFQLLLVCTPERFTKLVCCCFNITVTMHSLQEQCCPVMLNLLYFTNCLTTLQPQESSAELSRTLLQDYSGYFPPLYKKKPFKK